MVGVCGVFCFFQRKASRGVLKSSGAFYWGQGQRVGELPGRQTAFPGGAAQESESFVAVAVKSVCHRAVNHCSALRLSCSLSGLSCLCVCLVMCLFGKCLLFGTGRLLGLLVWLLLAVPTRHCVSSCVLCNSHAKC